MSYLEDNKNFIHQYLVVEMRGLSDAEKVAKYEFKKEDNRKRLAESYLKCGNDKEKVEFYNEAFLINSFFESDFLMLNLFFESKSEHFFISLTDSKCFDNLNFQSLTELPYKFWNYMRCPLSEEVEGFLKQEFLLIIDDITEQIWNSESETKNDVVRAYANWLMNNIKNAISLYQVYYSAQLFCKIWNKFSAPFNNLKAIVFLNKINEQFEMLKISGIHIDLNKIINLMEEGFSILFVNDIKYFPLIDKNDNPLYSSEYLSKRNILKNNIEISKKLNKSYIELTYNSIFTELCQVSDISLVNKINSDEIALINKINSDLKQKINNFEIPTKEELNFIDELECDSNINKIKLEFYRCQYLYEKLDYI